MICKAIKYANWTLTNDISPFYHVKPVYVKNCSTKGASGKCWRKLTRGGGGVSQMLTIADGGGRGGPGTPDFGWRNMWTAPNDESMHDMFDICAIQSLNKWSWRFKGKTTSIGEGISREARGSYHLRYYLKHQSLENGMKNYNINFHNHTNKQV